MPGSMCGKSSRNAPTARFNFVKSGWGKKHKRWLRLYEIHPPKDTPFLPSDEFLKVLTETIPDVRFKRSVRYVDREFFQVFGPDKNIFTTRANVAAKAMRREFLRNVAVACSPCPSTLPIKIQESAKSFLVKGGFATVLWTGDRLIAHDAAGKRYERIRPSHRRLWPLFRNFERVCRPELPFQFPTAHL